jgi:amino acid transporter
MHPIDEDDVVLSQLGYKKELYRGLSALSNFAMGFSEVGVVTSIVSSYNHGLIAGGPVFIIWGFFITTVFSMIVGLSMAEICSAYPSAGCVYYWAAAVSPKKHGPLAAYITGWCNFLGNAAGDAAFAASFAGLFNAAVMLDGNTSLTNAQLVAVSILVLFLWSVLGALRIDRLGIINDIAAALQIITILLVAGTACFISKNKQSSSSFVYTTYNNETGFDSISYVGALALVTSVYCFAGYEASGHLAEETKSSRQSAPWGIVTTCFVTGVGGLILFLSLLYCTPFIDNALNGDTSYASVNIFLNINHDWAVFLCWMFVLNNFFAGVSSVGVTARMTFALARDGGLPLSTWVSKLHTTYYSPVNAIVFVFTFDFFILLLPLDNNGAVAFYSIIGLAVIGFHLSYAIPIILKIYFAPSDFPSTPYSLGRFSTVFGVISSVWLLSTAVMAFFPSEYPITAGNMNWMIFIAFFVFVVSAFNWLVNSQYHFQGPHRYNESHTSPLDVAATSNPLAEDVDFRRVM